MKQRHKTRSLYAKKLESHAKKVAAAQAKVDQHKASGSPHLKAAQTKLRQAKYSHDMTKRVVAASDKGIKAAESAFKKFHAKKPKSKS